MIRISSRSAAALVGILVIVCYLVFKQSPFSGGAESSVDSKNAVVSKKPTSSDHTVSPSATSSQSARSNRSSEIRPDQAQAEIKRLIADDSVTILEAAKGLLSIARDRRVLPETRLDALQHGLTLVSDADYADMVLPELNANIYESPELQRVLLDNAYNREPIAKIPAVFALYKLAKGEMKDEARDLLAFITNVDAQETGDDLALWEAAVQKQLLEE